MAGRKTQPFRFNPRGVVDALDGGQVAPGGLAAATNLIFDSANPFTLACRPAAIKTYDFSDLTTPGAVSVAYVVGDICYGMIASGLVSTYDQPFAYNLATNALVTISGTQDDTTLPLTTTTPQFPPTMALVGPILYITHPGFVGGTSAFFSWIDTSDPTAPVYYAGNTATRALPSVPTCVAAYDDRAWLVCLNAINFTDAGNATPTISDPAGLQTIIVGDSNTITALASMPVETSVQGVIQSLVAFKPNIVGMITGTYTASNLTINIISSSVGCSTQRTVCVTPKGIMFEAIDGIRVIDHSGAIGEPNPDLRIPFIYDIAPSQSSACYNKNIYRISVQNGHVNGNPIQEWWFDFARNGWTGPHTFNQQMCVPYGNTTIAFNSSITPALFTSDVVQSGTSTFTENGAALSFIEQTAPMQDDGGMYEGSAVLSVIDMQVPQVAQSYSFIASDVNHGVLSTAVINFSSTGAIWDGFNWGAETWTATSYGMDRYNIPWTTRLVFSRLVFQITGASILNLRLGKLVVGEDSTRYVRTS